ncbi:MAG: hypothetical protein ACE5JI_06320, partial [Acidobacteriota bacterium]
FLALEFPSGDVPSLEQAASNIKHKKRMGTLSDRVVMHLPRDDLTVSHGSVDDSLTTAGKQISQTRHQQL